MSRLTVNRSSGTALPKKSMRLTSLEPPKSKAKKTRPGSTDHLARLIACYCTGADGRCRDLQRSARR